MLKSKKETEIINTFNFVKDIALLNTCLKTSLNVTLTSFLSRHDSFSITVTQCLSSSIKKKKIIITNKREGVNVSSKKKEEGERSIKNAADVSISI